MEACEVCTNFPTVAEKLLPGILNEITFDHVIPKLPRNTRHILPSINRTWLHAFRTAQLFYARLRSRSTEKLLVLTFNHVGAPSDGICLYSGSDNFCCELPPIPGLHGCPRRCQSVILDGKIYILGGDKFTSPGDGSDKVYVLDLAGQKQWKQCASMKEGRVRFGCGVINGKIYVFGGTSASEAVGGSEVYNPGEDCWSPIRKMMYSRVNCRVEAVGEELFVFGGSWLGRHRFDPKPLEPTRIHRTRKEPARIHRTGKALGQYDFDPTRKMDLIHPIKTRMMDLDDITNDNALVVEVYHPLKDEWRVVKPFVEQIDRTLYMVRGKFHSVTLRNADHSEENRIDIQVCDSDQNSWTLLHSFLLHKPADVIHVLAVEPVDDELVIKFYWTSMRTQGCWLVQSRGLGDENKETVWEKTQLPPPLGNLSRNRYSRIWTIQL